jgi:hypothetical protein
VDTKAALRQLSLAHPSSVRGKMQLQHAGLDLEAEQAALLGGIRVGSLDFLELYRSAIGSTELPPATPDKYLARPLKALMLVRCFERAWRIHPGGAVAECGVFRGFSARMLASAAREMQSGFDGSGMFLIDSFEGLAESSDEDTIVEVDEAAGKLRVSRPGRRFTTTSVDRVRRVLAGFPGAILCKGWIPAAFDQLPEQRWAFVHLDVDLYDATLAGLDYFYDRMLPGGSIVCDDYITPLYPGTMRAWDGFCERRGARFLILDTGQAVLTKDR